MWPFNKKTPAAKVPATVNTILCIPGHWKSDHEVKLELINATNGEYIAAGFAMINAKKNHHFTFEVCERDERMRGSFAVAGSVTGVSKDFLNVIDKHSLVVYISATTGSLVSAENMAFAGEALLKAGGIGIKVETAGKAFEKAGWLSLTSNFQEHHLYEMFVIDSLVEKDGTTFTCGMRNLGLKDTIVSGLPFQEAADLLSKFGYYQVVDKPVILPGQTFAQTVDSPLYRITEEPNPPYKDEPQLGNPFGVWRLTRAQSARKVYISNPFG